MAIPVFTTLLLDNVFAGAGSAAFAVPAGFRCVIRDIEVFESSPGGAIVEFATESGTVFWAVGPDLTTTYNTHQWQGRVVCNEGHQFIVSTTLAVNVVATGYLLALP